MSVLSSLALGLAVVVTIMSASMVLPFLLSTPMLGKMTPASMVNQLESMDSSLSEAKLAAMKNDDLTVAWHLNRLSSALSVLTNRPAFSTWLQLGDPPTADAWLKSIERTKTQIDAANLAISKGDAKELVKSIEAIQAAFAPLRAAVQRVRQLEKKDR